MTEQRQISGVLVVDKPVGPTSHDIVLQVRRILGTRVGHTGTLDPMASGVLVLTLGQATRLTRFFQSSDKVYEAELQLGIVTDSHDLEVGRFPVPPISPSKAQRLISRFQGTITQLPPMFSAVKVEGERLYKAARRKERRERPLRTITIHSIELLKQEEQNWTLRIHCSAGTYIRTLAHDLGVQLGCGASLSRLRRLQSGDFTLEGCVELRLPAAEIQRRVIPMENLLPDFPRLDVDGQEAARLANGQAIRISRDQARADYCRLFAQGWLLAIGEIQSDQIHPRIVFKNQLFQGPALL